MPAQNQESYKPTLIITKRSDIVFFKGYFTNTGEYIHEGTSNVSKRWMIEQLGGQYLDHFNVKQSDSFAITQALLLEYDMVKDNINEIIQTARQHPQSPINYSDTPTLPSSVRRPYYALEVNGENVWIEGEFDETTHQWKEKKLNNKSCGTRFPVKDLEKRYGINWKKLFHDVVNLSHKPDLEKQQFFQSIDAPNEYIKPKTMLMQVWSLALKKDDRDVKSTHAQSDVAFAQRIREHPGLKPMSDAGWLDKRSIRRTIDKTLHSDLTNQTTLNKNLARLAKYRLKKEYAMGNYVFGKWKRDRYQRKEVALTKILEANYVQIERGLTFDVLINRDTTSRKLTEAIGLRGYPIINPRFVKRIKLR